MAVRHARRQNQEWLDDRERLMTQYDYDLFVIGAGSGGVRASRVAASPSGSGMLPKWQS